MADNPFLASLVEALGGSPTEVPNFETEPYPDETLSPGMSAFIRTVRRFVVGEVDEHDFIDNVQFTANHLSNYLQLHRELAHSVPLNPPQQALAQLATHALIQFSEGLSDMVAFFGQGDLEQVEGGIDRCKQAIIVIEAWWIELSRVVRHQTSRVCPDCGVVSPCDAQECEGCQEPLPAPEDDFQPDQEYTEIAPYWAALCRELSGPNPPELAQQTAAEFESVIGDLASVSDWNLEAGWLADDLRDSCGRTVEALQQLQSALLVCQQDSPQTGWYQLVSALPEASKASRDLRYDMFALLEELEAESQDEVE